MREIKLVNDTISNQDIDKLIEWLKTYPRLTKGDKTIEFEEKWSKWLGVKHSVFVNSGSSANLMMLYALKLTKKLRNNTIVVPSLSWATDLAPVMQLGFNPVLVDTDIKNLSVNLTDLEEVFKIEAPAALMLVSVLGLPPNMTKIKELCQKYGVYLLEDTCESLGSEHKGQKLGTFGEMSTFSLYFGHHISTIEGGMICTDDDELYNILKMIRSHGWDRDLDEEAQKKLRDQWGVDNFSALYTFYVPGFNMRSTDLQAFLGIEQLKKLDFIVEKRFQNFCHFESLLKEHLRFWPNIPEGEIISSFCIPIILGNKKTMLGKCEEEKKNLVRELKKYGIESRPLIAGSLGTQPYYIKEYGRNEKKYCSLIDSNGLYVPNNPELSYNDIKQICNIIIKNI